MTGIFEKGRVVNLQKLISYSDGGIISKQILKNEAGNITLFSFDKGQGLSEHTAPFDAMVQILDGTVEITLGGVTYLLEKGESIIMPAHVAHALFAKEKFTMLLTMIKY